MQSIETSPGSFRATRRQSLATFPLWASSQELPVPLKVLAILRMRSPLDSGPNSFPTASTDAPNPRSAMCTLSATPNWKTILSRSVEIKAEVRSRVYWTNVLVDPRVQVDVIFTGCTGQISLEQVHEARRLFADRNRDFDPMCPRSKCEGTNAIL